MKKPDSTVYYMIYARPVTHSSLWVPERRFKTNQKKINLWAIKWDCGETLKLLHSRCCVGLVLCVCVYAQQNVYSMLFCTQTSILRFFNETRKNNHKTNIKRCCCCYFYLSFIAEKLNFYQFNTLTPFPIIVSMIILLNFFVYCYQRAWFACGNKYIYSVVLNWLLTLYSILACVVREESWVDWYWMFYQIGEC